MSTSNLPSGDPINPTILPPAPVFTPKPPIIKIDTGAARPPLKKAEPAATAPDQLGQLKSYVATVMGRYTEVETLFKDKKVEPTKNAEFKKFVDDTLSEISMRYVVFGTFSMPGSQEEALAGREDQMKNSGFTVSQDKLKGLDPALADHPAALMALAEGADLNGDSEN